MRPRGSSGSIRAHGGVRAAEQAFVVAARAAATLREGKAPARVQVIQQLVSQVTLGEQAITVAVGRGKLLSLLSGRDADADTDSGSINLCCDTVRVRRGHELRLIIPGPSTTATAPVRDEKLVALVAEAHAARELVMASPNQSLAAIASSAGRCRTRLTRLLALSCLAPDIVTAIVEGRQPAGLTTRVLLAADLPLGWAEQRALLNIA